MRTVIQFLWQASLFLVALLIGLGIVPNTIADTVFRYVNANVQGGTGDGASWTNAYQFLQDALTDAENATANDPYEIWVAAGTYYPDRSAAAPDGSCDPAPCDRNASFILDTNDVRL